MNRNALDFCQEMQLKLRPEGRACLRPGQTPPEFFAELMAAGDLADARRVLAHALPRPRALWWGCLCLWDAFRPEPPAAALDVLRTLTAYLQDPTDARRRALRPLGRAAGLNTAAGNLAAAGFCSAGSVSLPGLPEVASPSFATGRLVGVAVYLASVHREPARYKDHLRQFLALGLEVGRGENLWPSQPPVATAPRVPVPAVAVPTAAVSAPDGALASL